MSQKDSGGPPDLTIGSRLTYDPRRSELTEVHPRGGPKQTLPKVESDFGTLAASSGEADSTFRLRETVGQGGIGEVWSAVQGSLSRLVAVKKLRGDVLHASRNRAALLDAFRQEALTAAYLEHPNIVPVYDLGADSAGRPLLAMKLVNGSAWSELIGHDLAAKTAGFFQRHLPILVHVARAVAFAHSRGIVHRDLKPSQVMVGEFGEVLLMDWGLALVYDSELAGGSALPTDSLPDTSSASTPAGTPAFMAPEQTRQTPEDIGPWTDLYLLGATLYVLLCGSAPHETGDVVRSIAHASNGTVTPPSRVSSKSEVPAELEKLAMWALEPDPASRPASIDDFIGAIELYLDRASRHRDSELLTSSVAEELGDSSCDYAQFAAAIARLDEARGLWRENPALPGLRGNVLRAYTESALDREDLALARIQAQAHPDFDERKRLCRAVDDALTHKQTLARQRMFGILASFVLALGLAGGAFKYLHDQETAAAELREQRDLALVERGRAEGLVGFMLDDLWSRLQPLARSDLLESVARQAIAYYQNRPGIGMTTEERRQRGTALIAIGEVFRDRGELLEAEEAFHRAISIYEQLLVDDPDDPELIEEVYSALASIGAVQSDRGETDRALQTLETLRDRCQTALVDTTAPVVHRAYLATAFDQIGVIRFDQGKLEAARETFELGVAHMEDVMASQPGPEEFLDLSSLLMHRAVTTNALGQPKSAFGDLERASTLLDRAIAAQPDDRTLLRQRSFLAFLFGETLSDLARFSEAVEKLRSGLAFLEQLVEEDPNNVEHRYLLSLTLLELGNSLDALGRTNEARAVWNHVLTISDVPGEQLYLKDTRLRALVQLGLVDRAQELAADLLGKGWTHQDFGELAAELGLGSDP